MVKHTVSRRPKPNSRMPAIMIALLVLVSTITMLVAFPFSNISNDTSHMQIPGEDSSPSNKIINDRGVTPPQNIEVPRATASVQDNSHKKEKDKILATSLPLVSPNSPLIPGNKQQQYHVHFIHVPKCGGTSMTTVLRQMMCQVDPVRNRDCCLNPGFCEHQSNRKCSVVKGCINHFPNRC
jgi:hypothetical protein